MSLSNTSAQRNESTKPKRETPKGTVHLLDYVAGNVRSLVNAIEKCGWEVKWIRKPEDVDGAEVSDFLYFLALVVICYELLGRE